MKKISFFTACVFSLSFGIWSLSAQAENSKEIPQVEAGTVNVVAHPESPEPAAEPKSNGADPAPSSVKSGSTAPTLEESAPIASPEPLSSVKENKIIKVIDVKGNKTIGISTILSKIKIRVGDEYLENIISDDVKRLYNTGYFSDVSVDREEYEEGFKVIIYLTEKSIIEKITFSKLRYQKPRSIQNKLKTKEGKFLDNKVLKDDIQTIKDLYAKKGLTSAEVDVETTIDDTTNKAKLHFIIKEGYRIKIRRVKVVGNKAFPYRKIVRTIKTRPAWLFEPGYLKQDLLEEDMERIKSFYEKEGFIDATTSFVTKDLGKGSTELVINIEEGSRYYVGSIVVAGNSVLSETEILAAMKEIKVGKVFSREKLEQDLSTVRTVYFDKGYIFADIQESTALNPETGKVEIKLTAEEGMLAYVNKVKIEGNARTRDIVIRREIRLYPGDRFDGVKLRRSKDRLKGLGYFEDVNYDITDTDDPAKKDLVVQVKEAKTGTLSFGGGYSTVDQLVGFVEIEQRNFDFTNWPTFTGGGQHLSLRAETGSLRNNTRLSFTEPWIFDYPISGGFDVYRSSRDRERDVGYGYDETRTGGDIHFGKELSEYMNSGLFYKREVVKISNLEEGATADLQREVGTNTLSDVGLNISRDSRDSEYNPTHGMYLNLAGDVAGQFLGGDKEFYRIQNTLSYNVPMLFQSVLEFRSRIGFMEPYGDSEVVPIFERFFAGGARTIRGYNERGVGPLDLVTEDPIGGEALFVGNIEYTVPVIDFLKLATFFDTGNVWAKSSDFGSDEFKSGAGLGLRVKTPIGPINLDYGYPLNDEPGEEKKTGKFYFSVSRGF